MLPSLNEHLGAARETKMDLKKVVRQEILNEVIRAVKTKGEEKVLIADNLGMRMISACFEMHEVKAEGIKNVEALEKEREPLPTMKAIYLIEPTKKSTDLLRQDFPSAQLSLYKVAHVFFTGYCSDEMFDEICESPSGEKIETMQEINIAFLPYESQVFSLDCNELSRFYYDPTKKAERTAILERIAEQLATVCASLG